MSLRFKFYKFNWNKKSNSIQRCMYGLIQYLTILNVLMKLKIPWFSYFDFVKWIAHSRE